MADNTLRKSIEPGALKQPTAKPFIKWAGGKSKILSALLAAAPESIDTYYEPMLGGGALFFALRDRIKKAVLSDTSEELINCFICVRDKLPDLMEDLKQHPHSEDYYYELRNADREQNFSSWSDVARASRFIYLNKTCYNGLHRVNSKGQFNVPFGRYSNPKILDESVLGICSCALQGAELRSTSFETICARAKKDDFVYFDPPYAPLSRTASFTSYSVGGFGTDSQMRLRDVCSDLDKRGVKFLLSNSYTTLTLDLYQDFHTDLIEAPRAINSKGTKRGKIKEILVRNY